MSPSNMNRILLLAVLLLGNELLRSPPHAGGQELDRIHFGIGYVANAPKQMAGGGAYVLFPDFGGIGVYVDVKGTIDSPTKERAFEEGLTYAEVLVDPRYAGTRFLRNETSWRRSYNAALVRPLNPFLMIYAGGGYSQAEDFVLLDVPQGDVGRALWVRDPDADQDGVNLMVGLFLRLLPGISTQIGFETKPKGFTAGVSLRLPSW